MDVEQIKQLTDEQKNKLLMALLLRDFAIVKDITNAQTQGLEVDIDLIKNELTNLNVDKILAKFEK